MQHQCISRVFRGSCPDFVLTKTMHEKLSNWVVYEHQRTEIVSAQYG